MIIVQIAGRLGKDPETRFTPSNQKVTTMTVATTVRKGGKEETVWWRVTIWGDRFDKMLTYLKKGSAVVVVGEMNKPDIWTDKEGRPQVSLELTAEIIRFSPFGNPDKPEQANVSHSAASATQFSENMGTASYGSMSGSAMHTPSSGYSSNQGAMHYNQPSHSEDPLPF